MIIMQLFMSFIDVFLGHGKCGGMVLDRHTPSSKVLIDPKLLEWAG